MKRIQYRAGYKYQLASNYVHQLPQAFAGIACRGSFYHIKDCVLTIVAGYAWDGPSGPTVDTANFMRGSLVHDVLYQACRQRFIPDSLRDEADRELQRICREDGMSAIRAWWVYRAVFRFGAASADPDNRKPILIAP